LPPAAFSLLFPASRLLRRASGHAIDDAAAIMPMSRHSDAARRSYMLCLLRFIADARLRAAERHPRCAALPDCCAAPPLTLSLIFQLMQCRATIYLFTTGTRHHARTPAAASPY